MLSLAGPEVSLNNDDEETYRHPFKDVVKDQFSEEDLVARGNLTSQLALQPTTLTRRPNSRPPPPSRGPHYSYPRSPADARHASSILAHHGGSKRITMNTCQGGAVSWTYHSILIFQDVRALSLLLMKMNSFREQVHKPIHAKLSKYIYCFFPKFLIIFPIFLEDFINFSNCF